MSMKSILAAAFGKTPVSAVTRAAAIVVLSTGFAQAGQAIEAGPIWNQKHADQVCPAIAASHGGKWTGHWWTTEAGKMSVCQVTLPAPARSINAGPIWNQKHANEVCPAIAHAHGGEWTGHWWTTVAGKMSVCQIR